MKDWWKRVVRINATTELVKSTGTGFLIGPDRVLTAEHVVLAEVEEAKLEIRFDGQRGAAADVDAEVVWRSSSDPDRQPFDLDVAVIRLGKALPAFETETPQWRFGADGHRHDWLGAGFPKKLQLDGKVVGLAGRTYTLQEGVRLELGVEDPPEDQSYWKGASGTAVLVDGRIVAVVTDASLGATGRLYATPLGLLASTPAFREACLLPSREEDERYERDRKEGARLLRLLRERAAVCLERSPRGRAMITRHFPDYVSDAFPRPTDRMNGDAFVGCFIEPPPQEIVALLDRARRDLKAEGAPENDLLAVRECLSYFLPTALAKLWDDDRVYRIHRMHPNVRVYRSRIGSRGVAALLHARRVGGPIKVRPLPGSHELLTGLSAVELSLRTETSLDDPVDLRKLCVDLWESLGYGTLSWNDGAGHRDETFRIVNRALAADRKKGTDGNHPYVVVRLMGSESHDRELRALEFIQSKLPELNLVVCDGAFDDDEADWLVSLRNFFLES